MSMLLIKSAYHHALKDSLENVLETGVSYLDTLLPTPQCRDKAVIAKKRQKRDEQTTRIGVTGA